MIFLRVFKHLLPRARAWRITIDKKLRQFFDGLSSVGSESKTFFDNIFDDIFPNTTRQLDEWDQNFALRDTGIDEQQRRSRLSATWRALGGQSPGYIQDTLRANGFDVYVHEWWEPGTEPAIGVKQCVTPRNPLLVLRREFTNFPMLVECNEALAQCGEALAQAGETLMPRGYPLVNKIFITERDILPLCGEAFAAAGEPDAICGNFIEFSDKLLNYIVPDAPEKWPYFLYIGAEVYGELAQVDPKRRDEFEALCLKICPTQQWIGMLVEYV